MPAQQDGKPTAVILLVTVLLWIAGIVVIQIIASERARDKRMRNTPV
jgi:hypothetical protein